MRRNRASVTRYEVRVYLGKRILSRFVSDDEVAVKAQYDEWVAMIEKLDDHRVEFMDHHKLSGYYLVVTSGIIKE